MHRWDTLSPITAACSVTSCSGRRAGLTRLPSDALSPQFPTMIAHRPRSEKMPLANLCNRLCCQLRAPCESTDSRATSSHSHVLRRRLAPLYRVSPAPISRLRTLVRITKLRCRRRRRLTTHLRIAPLANSYPDLESRSGWCRRRELCSGFAVPFPESSVGADRAPCSLEPVPVEARAGLLSRNSRARQNHPLTLPVTPPVLARAEARPFRLRPVVRAIPPARRENRVSPAPEDPIPR